MKNLTTEGTEPAEKSINDAICPYCSLPSLNNDGSCNFCCYDLFEDSDIDWGPYPEISDDID